ncbi:MAG TPA: DUF1839 family protein [Gemmatimonadaceae bacterium]|nr:DUF1839 family protein [Gemmatimonadaceae bacterium]
MSRQVVLPGLDAGSYKPHMLHAENRIWVEKNCYIDIVIELVHALDLEPLAAMGFCAAVDFEGDCFTFFKPPHDELRELFGLDIQELNVWRPLLEHSIWHLGAGKLISTEADAFHLPDTSATDYRRNHVKTTIILADLDVEQRRLGYFHNAGFYTLEGDDFESLFRLSAAPDPAFMPLFAELVRVDRLRRLPAGELAEMARLLLAKHVSRRPAVNPLTKFHRRFQDDLGVIQREGLNYYHTWAFATIRQMGAAFESLSLHLRWLMRAGAGEGFGPAAEAFERLSLTAKAFILKAARVVNSRRPFDASSVFDEMSGAWYDGMTTLAEQLGLPARASST